MECSALIIDNWYWPGPDRSQWDSKGFQGFSLSGNPLESMVIIIFLKIRRMIPDKPDLVILSHCLTFPH